MSRGSQGAITLLGIAAGLAFGVLIGVGGFTFTYARGGSYLTNDPKACANCHIMREQYEGWTRASHHAVAVCNDCHTPHDFAGKWFTKALNGWNHSFAFTTGLTDEQLNKPRDFQRKAQFLLDFAEAENSTGFHAPQEGSRILGLSLDYSRQGQQTLASLWREKAGGGAPSQASRAPAGVDAPRPIPGAVAKPPDVMKR